MRVTTANSVQNARDAAARLRRSDVVAIDVMMLMMTASCGGGRGRVGRSRCRKAGFHAPAHTTSRRKTTPAIVH